MSDQLDFLDELKICEHVWFYRDWGEPHRHLNYSICVKCGKKKVSDKKATEADLKNYENPELLGIPDPINIPQTECKE